MKKRDSKNFDSKGFRQLIFKKRRTKQYFLNLQSIKWRESENEVTIRVKNKIRDKNTWIQIGHNNKSATRQRKYC